MNHYQLSRYTPISIGLLLAGLILLFSVGATGLALASPHGESSRMFLDQPGISGAAPQDPSMVAGVPGFISEGIFIQCCVEETLEEDDDDDDEKDSQDKK